MASTRTEELLSKAQVFMSASKWEEAIASCDQAIAIDPKLAMAYFLRAKCRPFRGGTWPQVQQQQQETVRDLLRAKEFDPDNRLVRKQLALEYATVIKDYSKAVIELTELLQKYRGDSSIEQFALEIRARVFVETRQFEKALEDYRRIGGGNPGSAQIVENLEEVTRLSKQIAANPGNADLFLQRGQKFFELNMKKDCLEDCDKAIALNSKLVQAYLTRAAMTGAMPNQDNAKALVFYNRACQLAPVDPNVLARRAFHYFSCGQLDKAIADFSDAIELAPSDSGLYASRARMYNMSAIGKSSSALYEKALDDANRAIALNSRNGGAYLERGSANIGLGKKDQGRHDYQRARELGVMAPD